MDENTQTNFMGERYKLLFIKIAELILVFLITKSFKMDNVLETYLVTFVFIKIILDLVVLIWSVFYEKIYIQMLEEIHNPNASENDIISLVDSVESYSKRNKSTIDMSKFYTNVYKFHKKITTYYASLIVKEGKEVIKNRNINTDKVNINDEKK